MSIAIASAAAMAAAFIVPTGGVAHATAVTCITSSASDSVCTTVDGSGNYVTDIEASWNSILPPYNICNYSAWFYYVPPTGGAYGLDYQSGTAAATPACGSMISSGAASLTRRLSASSTTPMGANTTAPTVSG